MVVDRGRVGGQSTGASAGMIQINPRPRLSLEAFDPARFLVRAA